MQDNNQETKTSNEMIFTKFILIFVVIAILLTLNIAFFNLITKNWDTIIKTHNQLYFIYYDNFINYQINYLIIIVMNVTLYFLFIYLAFSKNKKINKSKLFIISTILYILINVLLVSPLLNTKHVYKINYTKGTYVKGTVVNKSQNYNKDIDKSNINDAKNIKWDIDNNDSKTNLKPIYKIKCNDGYFYINNKNELADLSDSNIKLQNKTPNLNIGDKIKITEPSVEFNDKSRNTDNKNNQKLNEQLGWSYYEYSNGSDSDDYLTIEKE